MGGHLHALPRSELDPKQSAKQKFSYPSNTLQSSSFSVSIKGAAQMSGWKIAQQQHQLLLLLLNPCGDSRDSGWNLMPGNPTVGVCKPISRITSQWRKNNSPHNNAHHMPLLKDCFISRHSFQTQINSNYQAIATQDLSSWVGSWEDKNQCFPVTASFTTPAFLHLLLPCLAQPWTQ